MDRAAPLLLIGGGGHASDVLEAVEAVNRSRPTWEVVGLLDDRVVDERRFRGRGAAHLGGVDDAAGHDGLLLLAVGWPSTKRALTGRLPADRAFATVVHPTVGLSALVALGAGTVVLDRAHVSAGAVLGRHVLVSYLASVGHDSVVGDWSSVMPGAHVAGEVTIGEGVLIGAGAVVLQGRSVGDGASVGAGAVVTRDVPAGATVVGSPARPT